MDAQEYIRYRSCTAKVPMTRGEARDARRKMQANSYQHRGAVSQLRAYKCPYCDMWHIGHATTTPERKRKERKRKEDQ